MRVMLIGSGGREHALAWKLAQSPTTSALYALPGSDAIAQSAELVKADPLDPQAVVHAAEQLHCDLVVVGPEAPLAAGLTDELQKRGLKVFGPTRAAARLETSKVFAKGFMQRQSIPTARYATAHSLEEARRALDEFEYPVVLKADGLAAGKGVVIAETAAEATRTLQAMFSGELVGQAGSSVVIEEFLSGDEVSFLALCDGQRAIGLVPAQDHKRVFDGDRGPNTGGMGAYSTDELLSPVLRTDIESRIVNATLNAMRSEGTPFAGVLYCGLMLTRDGPRVLEYNVRFGDPETQAIMLRFEGDLTVALASAATGELNLKAVRWSGEPSACVVVASGGYPGKYATGVPIEGVDRAASEKGMVIFHAGTKRVNGRWQTAGGRVLGVSARGQSLSDALKRCYNAIEQIHFDGMHYRHDIGARALSEHSFTQRHGERRERKTHSLP